MTSRISSIKIRTEDMKHRLAMILISVFVFFMRDLFLFISIQNLTTDQTLTPERLRTSMLNVIKGFTAPGVIHLLYLVPFAMLLAMNGFHYLHNRSRVDLMHALPVSRGRIYRTILGNGLVIFLVPYLLSLLVETCYVQYLGCMGHDYLSWLYTGIIFTLLIFLMHYLLMAFCMTITGHTFVAFLAFGVFELYTPLLLTLNLQAYAGIFFKTFCSLSGRLVQVLNWLSPATAGYMLANHRTMGTSQLPTGPYVPFIVVVLWIAVLLVVSYLAFHKYPSERAGYAMVFRRGKKLIKLMIVVPMAMFVGLLFYEITLERSYLWLYFGVVFGVLLFHGIVECIYRFDIRGLWSAKVDLLFVIVATVLCVLCFDVDIIKFDERVPDATQVSYVKVSTYYGYYNDSDSKGIPAENAGQLLDILNQVAAEVESAGVDDPEIQVTYDYGSGKIEERKYSIRHELYDRLEEELYSLKDYKRMIYGIYAMEPGEITDVTADHPIESTTLKLDEDQKKELLDLLREETDALTYQEMTTEQPVTKLMITYRHKEPNQDIYPEGYTERDETYDIFPSYEKTIAFLKGQKAVVASNAADYDISQIVLSHFVSVSEDGGYEYENYTIRDQAFIGSIKDKLYFYNLDAQTTANVNFTENSYVTAKIAGVDYEFHADKETLAAIYKKALE